MLLGAMLRFTLMYLLSLFPQTSETRSDMPKAVPRDVLVQRYLLLWVFGFHILRCALPGNFEHVWPMFSFDQPE